MVINMMEFTYEEMAQRVPLKTMRMFLQMRMETILREKFGSTDAELELHRNMEEICELVDIEGYRFSDGEFAPMELFMVKTEIEELPGEAVSVRMQCN